MGGKEGSNHVDGQLAAGAGGAVNCQLALVCNIMVRAKSEREKVRRLRGATENGSSCVEEDQSSWTEAAPDKGGAALTSKAGAVTGC